MGPPETPAQRLAPRPRSGGQTDAPRQRRVTPAPQARNGTERSAGAPLRPRPSASGRFGPPPDYRARRIFVAAVALAVVALVGLVLVPLTLDGPVIDFDGLSEGDAFTSEALVAAEVAVTATPADAVDDAVVRLDGTEVETARDGDRLVFRPAEVGVDLAEGEHVVEVSAGSGRLWRGASTASLTFRVDNTQPVIEVNENDGARPIDEPLRIAGRTEPGSAVTVQGAEAEVDADGGFSVTLPFPPIGQVDIVAIDAAGNRTEGRVNSGVALPTIKAVHVTALAWTVAKLRDPVIEMAEAGRINAIQLDLKDESGIVGHRTDVARANEIGAAGNLYELADVVEEIHALGLRVVGRIVVYRDPEFIAAARAAGKMDDLVLTADGQAYEGKYGGFANPASEAVTTYNRDLAVEAAAAGVDDILFDYIRRPEGPIDGLEFPGAEGPIEDEIIDFLVEVGDSLAVTGARMGVSVFGIAAKNPEQIAQPIDRMAREVDYIAPMVYPSHWGPGWYGVDNPNAQPYDIVAGSLAHFQEKVEGTDARIVPWLQDFDLGGKYGDKEVRAQIDAAKDLGIDDWLMWDPNVTYHAGGLPAP